MTDVTPHGPEVRRVPTIARLAGVLLALLGLTNVLLSAIAATTTRIRLPDLTATLLGMLGLATVVLGVLVARGSRVALVTALVVFGGLFAVQAFAVTDGAGSTPAVITLAVVLVPIVLAVHATRRDD